MYDHHIQEIAEAIRARRLMEAQDLEPGSQVMSYEDIIRGYFSDKIAIVWQIPDIKKHAEEHGYDLTDDQAYEVLQMALNEHDCNYGITWEVLLAHIHSIA